MSHIVTCKFLLCKQYNSVGIGTYTVNTVNRKFYLSNEPFIHPIKRVLQNIFTDIITNNSLTDVVIFIIKAYIVFRKIMHI